MSGSPVIVARNISKKFCRSLRQSLWYGVLDIGQELLLRSGTASLRRDEFWALENVSFDLSRGEALGVVGHNGAGKSTLMKILYGLIKPDRGQVVMNGRAEALIELGTGFSPVLTGRENIRIGAALHGLDWRKAAELQERVIDFAELEEFIDTPLSSYSAGMKARLSFSVASHLASDILLVDEVLAVGDFAFQRKCARKMLSFLDQGGALLFVSHNTHQVQSICQRGILLDRGRVAFSGTAVETLNALFEKRTDETNSRSLRAETPPPNGLTIEDLYAEPLNGDVIGSGEPVRIVLRYRSDGGSEHPEGFLWGFSIWTADQWVCIAGEHDLRKRFLPEGEGELSCVIPRLPLVGGRYSLRGGITDYETYQPVALFGWSDAATAFEVKEEATLVSNAKMMLNQLVTIDVDWD